MGSAPRRASVFKAASTVYHPGAAHKTSVIPAAAARTAAAVRAAALPAAAWAANPGGTAAARAPRPRRAYRARLRRRGPAVLSARLRAVLAAAPTPSASRSPRGRSFEDLHREYNPYLHRYLRSRVPPDDEPDIRQETWHGFSL